MTEARSDGSKWLAAALLWGSHFVTFIIRVALGVAAPVLMKTYGISPATMGYVLAGWNWMYTAGVVLVGPVVDRLGPYVVMGTGSLVWGAATLLFPLGGSALAFFLLRSLYGAGHCMLLPAGAAGVSRFFGSKERALSIGLIFSGGSIGTAVGTTVSGLLLHQWGWQAIFYGVGGTSLFWTVLWFLFYPDKRIGPASVDSVHGAGRAVSWRVLLRHRSTWGIAGGQMGYLYAYFFFVTWLPGYLVLERKMTILRTSFVASLPFWAGMLGTIGGGMLGDYLIHRGVDRTVSRKVMIGSALTLATITVVCAAFTEETVLAVTLLTLSVGFLRMSTASGNATAIDLAPPGSVASLTSLQSFGGNLVSLAAPIVTGYIVEMTGSFVWALVVAGGMAMFGAVSYVFVVGRLEPMKLKA